MTRVMLLKKALIVFILVGVLIVTAVTYSRRSRVVFEKFDRANGYRMIAVVEKVRPGLEGWDLIIKVESSNGHEVARSTVSSLDRVEDVRLPEFTIISVEFSKEAEEVVLKFADQRRVEVPVTWNMPVEK